MLSQSASFLDYNGIPIVANLWGSANYLYDKHNFADLTVAGVNAVVCSDLIPDAYSALTENSNLKVIPYQVFATISRKGIAYYSERAYSEWEAEGNDNYGINLDCSEGVLSEDGHSIRNRTAVSDTIIKGPRYYQLYNSLFNNTSIFTYFADFRLKIVHHAQPPQNGTVGNNDVVCVILASTEYTDKRSILHYKIMHEITLKVSDFTNGYNNWQTFQVKYNNTKNLVPSSFLETRYKFNPQTGMDIWQVIPNVQFKVIWMGLSYLDLYVDKVTVYDEEGGKLKSGAAETIEKLNQEQNNEFDDFDNTDDIIAWAPIDEPNFIDNLECVKLLDDYLYNHSNFEQRLFTAIAGCWKGSVKETPTDTIYKVDEYYKRANYHGGKINNYIYNYPYEGNTLQSWKANIRDMLDHHLSKINKQDPNFMCSVQTGKWIVNAEHDELNVIPTREQFLYNINVDLLYGAKGIELNQYYYFYKDNDPSNTDTTTRNSLVCVHSDSHNNSADQTYFTPLWHVLADEISPRLKSDYGILLKNLNQSEQKYLRNVDTFKTIGDITFSKSGTSEYDCGVFTKPNFDDKKYFMIVSRFYNAPPLPENPHYVEYTITNLSDVNYTIKEFYEKESSFLTKSGNTITFNTEMLPGEARLYELMPLLKYGGILPCDDTVKTSRELIGDLEIGANKKLYIKNATYTVKDTILIKTGGAILRKNNGNIMFAGTGKIINESWTNSLFYTVEGENPKLIWGYQPGPKTYNIYKYQWGVWTNIGTVSTLAGENAHKQFFVDTEEIIYGGTSTKRYKVVQGTTSTNEINIPILPKFNEEDNANSLIKEFRINQNYPNPFNGTTQIKYIIPQNGKVSIMLYDILGKEVKNIYDGMQEQGEYDIKLDCDDLASGIYIYRIEYKDQVLSKKLLLMK